MSRAHREHPDLVSTPAPLEWQDAPPCGGPVWDGRLGRVVCAEHGCRVECFSFDGPATVIVDGEPMCAECARETT